MIPMSISLQMTIIFVSFDDSDAKMLLLIVIVDNSGDFDAKTIDFNSHS